jgi:hypothetical protein
MTPSQPTAHDPSRQDPRRWSSQDRAQAFADFLDPFRRPASLREYAFRHDIPESTLRGWFDLPDTQGVEPEVVSFFRTPAGERFLRRLVLAAHVAFRQVGPAGLGCLRLFLQWSLLDRFVASSHGAQHALAVRIEALLVQLATQLRPLLAAGMTTKTIALVPDEHFHSPCPCLIAIEPVSNFILLEQYAAHRDTSTWTRAIKAAIAFLPVEVLLLTSDRAAALIGCAEHGLEAEHLPELFHGQRELCGPVLGALGRHNQAAQKELEDAEFVATYWAGQLEEPTPGGPGRPPDCARRAEASQRRAEQCATEAQACSQRQEQASQAIRGLGDDYHPFDSQTGVPVTAEQMEQKLRGRLGALAQVVQEADLPDKADKAMQRGGEWVVALVGVLAWFWGVAKGRVAALGLSEAAEQAVEHQLLPGLYWEQAARRGRTAEERRDRQELAEGLLEQARSLDGPLGRLEEGERAEVERVAKEVVGLWARSSSCVEGRNGRLALFQHGQSRLSQRRLEALTAVHNYVSRRPDGSTAAERFFGQKHPDAFEWLLARLPDLPRPAAKRPRKASSTPARTGQACADR